MFEHENTIANLACSLMRHFGVEDIPNAALLAADRLLKRGARNVVLLLLDGMGKENLEEMLPENGFFRRHLAASYYSVFPPTTVAATTAVDSGLFPSQHGRLGWTVYYPDYGKNITVFLNKDDEGNQAPYPVADTHTPYVSIIDRIGAAGAQACSLSPYGDDPVTDLADMASRLKTLCAAPGRHYIYCYWPEPDGTMHQEGSAGERVRAELTGLEKWAEECSAGLSDTLLLITADHGHTDAVGAALDDYPDIRDCLVRLPSIEPRCVNLFVKDGKIQALKDLFRRHFGEDFLLFERGEALDKGLFGPAPRHPMLDKMVGDLVAVSRNGRTLFNTRGQMLAMPGVHAGGTARERDIPLIAVFCGESRQ